MLKMWNCLRSWPCLWVEKTCVFVSLVAGFTQSNFTIAFVYDCVFPLFLVIAIAKVFSKLFHLDSAYYILHQVEREECTVIAITVN